MRTSLAILLAALAQGAALGASPWWDESYAARREVTAYSPYVRLPGDDAAVAEFYTGGVLRPDGSDIRVIAGRREVPHKLYGLGPGDKATISFKVDRAERTYHIYFGNRDAAAPGADWEPQRGLILETRGYKGGNPPNLARMLAIYNNSDPFYGTGEVSRIWHGHNPFGPTQNFVSRYLGWLVCQVPGTYHFATSSDDASFLLIDGKLTASWPGWHGPVGDARHNGKVELTRGLHRLEYLHVSRGGTSCAVAAWRRPAAQGFEVIPATAFAPLSRVEVGPLELHGESTAPDFELRILGEALMTRAEPLYAVKLFFNNRTKGASQVRAVHWDFGDGLSGEGPAVTHTYLAEGIYPVTMRLGDGENAPVVRQRIQVHQHWGWQTKQEIDDITDYFPEISGYDVARLDLGSLINLMKLSSERGSYDHIRKVALSLVSRPGEINRADLEHALASVRQTLGLERLMRDEEILRAYSQAFKTAAGAAKAALAMELSEVLLESGGAAEATVLIRAALAERLPDEARRRSFIALADAARLQGDAAAAKAALEAADAIKLERTQVQESATSGALALAVEDYLADGRCEEALGALRRWDWEAPLEKLAGYSSYLYGRTYLRQGRRARALGEFEAIAAVSPESPWAPGALIEAADLLAAQGKFSAAAQRLDKIVTQYRTSPEADRAARLLKNMAPSEKGEGK